MSKRDRHGVRNATDIERKYNLGNVKKAYSEVKELSVGFRGEIAQVSTTLRQEIAQKANSLAEVVENVENAIVEATEAANEAYRKASEATNKLAELENDVESATRIANEAGETANGVVNDLNSRFEFVEGGTTFKGAIVPLVLPQGADLDGITLPNKYTGGSVTENQYLNCPIATGTFSLEVEACGDQGELLQRLTYGHKTAGKTYERVFHTDGWGEWIIVTDYTGAALNALQVEIDALEQAFSEFVASTAAGVAETDVDVDALKERTQKVEQSVKAVAADLQGVITDVNDHFEFNEGGLTIKGAINPALIPAGADLDSLLISNKYISGNVAESNYKNCPVISGTFLLEVDQCGYLGQIKQTLSYSNKTKGKTFERYYYSSGWGEWVVVTDFAATAKLLWNDGVYYMTATQTVNLPEAVSAQKNGIVLVFSEYANGAASDTAFHCFFVPKGQVTAHPGKGYVFTLATSKFAQMATKQVYIYDEKIEGHADNNQTGTGESGLKFTNNRFVLRYVLGV